MPIYAYQCPEHGEFEQLFKTTTAADKNKDVYPCPDCGAEGKRLPVPSSFASSGTQHSDMEKAVGMQTKLEDIGGRLRPVYTDANGQRREIKSSGDIRRWQRSNQMGPPIMTEWKNPVTGVKSMVPKRQRMVAGADGEPMETLDNPILREVEQLVDLGPSEGPYTPPAFSKTMIPIDPKTGVVPIKDWNKVKIGGPGQQIVDPVNGKPMTLGDCWGGGSEPGYGGGVGFMIGGKK